jgi:hypothetical protein
MYEISGCLIFVEQSVHAFVQACGGPFLTFVVTVVNMRNVFCNELSEYAQLILYEWRGQLTIKFLA